MERAYLLVAATKRLAPEVRVLADSLARVDPPARRLIAVVDEDRYSLGLLESAGEIRTGSELGLDPDLVERLVGAYGAEGLFWATFPRVLLSAASERVAVLWIGANVSVVREPLQFWTALEKSDVVAGLAAPSLAPKAPRHEEEDTWPATDLQPGSVVAGHEGELVSRSVLGWQAGSSTLKSLVAEWPVPADDFVARERVARPAVAQIWFNSLACHEGISIVSSPGVALSPAQLLDHAVEATENGPVVDEDPLTMISLRAFDAHQPYALEGVQANVRVSEIPDLAPLLRDYSARLLKARTTGDRATSDKNWERLPEGLSHNAATQDLIRRGMRAGAITSSPFGERGFSQLRDYALQPARQGGSIGINRLLEALYSTDSEVAEEYPSLEGNDGLRFLASTWRSRSRMGIPDSFLPPRPAKFDGKATPRRRRLDSPGVNLAGYFTSELGLGESARQLATALEAAGVPLTPVQGLFLPPTRQKAEFSPVTPRKAHHDINIVVINGDQMEGFVRDVGEGFFAGRPSIGVWWWEVDPFPAAEWISALQWLDEVWVGSDFIRSLIEPHVDVPVWVFPAPVTVECLPEPVDRSHFGWSEDETVFLFIWDYHSTEARKNPSGLIEAYRRAFPDGGPTRLVMKSINHENLPLSAEKVRLAAAGRDDIQIIERFLSQREKNALLELCDCYVSPHRSEGFGYTPAEAMLLGKPVITTGYGGTTQYADESVARVVKWAPSLVGRGAHPYPPNGRWADPDLDDLANALRWIVEEPEAAAAMAERGRKRITERHNPAICGAAMRDRLEVVRARFDVPPRPAYPSLLRRIAGRLLRNRITRRPMLRLRNVWRAARRRRH